MKEKKWEARKSSSQNGSWAFCKAHSSSCCCCCYRTMMVMILELTAVHHHHFSLFFTLLNIVHQHTAIWHQGGSRSSSSSSSSLIEQWALSHSVSQGRKASPAAAAAVATEHWLTSFGERAVSSIIDKRLTVSTHTWASRQASTDNSKTILSFFLSETQSSPTAGNKCVVVVVAIANEGSRATDTSVCLTAWIGHWCHWALASECVCHY